MIITSFSFSISPLAASVIYILEGICGYYLSFNIYKHKVIHNILFSIIVYF